MLWAATAVASKCCRGLIAAAVQRGGRGRGKGEAERKLRESSRRLANGLLLAYCLVAVVDEAARAKWLRARRVGKMTVIKHDEMRLFTDQIMWGCVIDRRANARWCGQKERAGGWSTKQTSRVGGRRKERGSGRGSLLLASLTRMMLSIPAHHGDDDNSARVSSPSVLWHLKQIIVRSKTTTTLVLHVAA